MSTDNRTATQSDEHEAAAERLIAQAEAALDVGDPNEAVRLLETDPVGLANRQLDRLRALLDGLPDELVATSPLLSVIKEGAATFQNHERPRSTLSAAQRLAELDSADHRTARLVSAGLGEIFATRAVRDYRAGAAVAARDRAHVEADRADWLEVSGELRSVVLLQWGLSRMLVQDLVGATRDLQEAFWAGRGSTMAQVARNGAEDAALLLALVDSVDAAEDWLAKARTIAPASETVRGYVEEWDPLVEAALALARFELAAAREALARFRPAPETNLAWSVEAFLRARLGVLEGEPFGALDQLARVHHPRGGGADPGTFDEVLLAVAEADLALVAGRVPRAESVIDRVGPNPMLTATKARLALAKGDAGGALAQALAGMHDDVLFGRLDLAVTAALAQLRLGDRAKTALHVARALELSKAQGIIAPFALVPDADLEVFVELVPGTAPVVERVLDAPRGTVVHRPVVVELTEREKRVLAELASGATTQEIATRLFVSVNTVKTQVRSIYRKLGVNSREEALETAHLWGFDLRRPEG